MSKERLWTKDFITVSVINFFIALIFYLLIVTIASYALDTFHTSTSMAGLVSGIFIGALIGRLITGRIIDDVGSRKILILSLLFFAIASVLYLAAINLQILIINRFLHGLTFGVATTAIGTIIAQSTPAQRMGEGISYFSMSTILATAIGPFIGIFLIEYGNFNIIFVFNLILSIFCLVMSLAVSKLDFKSLPKQHKIKNPLKTLKFQTYLNLEPYPYLLSCQSSVLLFQVF